MSYKELCELEESPVAGIGINDQLRPRNPLGEGVGVDRRNHDVVISVHYQSRLADITELCKSIPDNLTPSSNGRSLGGHGLRRTRRIDILLAQVPALPK